MSFIPPSNPIDNSLGCSLFSSFVFRGPFSNLYLPGGAFTLRALSFGLEHLGTFFLSSFIFALDRAFCSWAVVLPPVPRDHRTASTLPEGQHRSKTNDTG